MWKVSKSLAAAGIWCIVVLCVIHSVLIYMCRTYGYIAIYVSYIWIYSNTLCMTYNTAAQICMCHTYGYIATSYVWHITQQPRKVSKSLAAAGIWGIVVLCVIHMLYNNALRLTPTQEPRKVSRSLAAAGMSCGPAHMVCLKCYTTCVDRYLMMLSYCSSAEIGVYWYLSSNRRTCKCIHNRVIVAQRV